MTAIILAAGFSRRFGIDKLLLEIDGKPIVLHVIDTVLGIGFKETILVYQNEAIRKICEGRPVKCIFNPASSEGISSSVKCGVRNSAPTDAFIFFNGDQPFIGAETVKCLMTAFYERKGSIIVPVYDGQNGTPVIFASEWKGQLELLTGDTGGRKIIKENPQEVYTVDVPNIKAGMDIDTHDDLLRLMGKDEK